MESNGLHSCSTNEEAAVKPGALPSELLVYPPTGRTKKLVRKENISRDEGKQFSGKQQALVFVANLFTWFEWALFFQRACVQAAQLLLRAEKPETLPQTFGLTTSTIRQRCSRKRLLKQTDSPT